MKTITTMSKATAALTTMGALALAINTTSCIKKIESKRAEKTEAPKMENQFVRLWTDTLNDSYLRLNLSTRDVDYMGVPFYLKRVQCEKALWMTVGQIQQLQARKENDDRQPGNSASGKNPKTSK